LKNSQFSSRSSDVIINWGNSKGIGNIPQYINHPEKVAIACNKLDTFSLLQLKQVSLPDWTSDKEQALQWATENTVYCRTILTGHSGNGIIIADSPEQVVNALLYTKATKAKYEYRVHVFRNKIIDFQQKKRKENHEGGIRGIRNHVNGWIYARNDITLPILVEQESIKAVNALGLDFGAVDIGYRQSDNTAFLYEVNTAPGLHGTTLEKYVAAFKEII
jgi:glutathione synthase/RimK-type ligase-like ATP-grasp enzyme